MVTDLRRTGIDIIGDIPWGTHVCIFYESKQDLLDTLVPYFRSGLESREYCLWIISDPLTEEEARSALRQAVPDLDRYMSEQSIEILSSDSWYLRGGSFELAGVVHGWKKKLDQALTRGYSGIRVSGNTSWVRTKDSQSFSVYEQRLDRLIANHRMLVLCTYPLARSGAVELLDVARTHQVAAAIRSGNWEIVETPELVQVKSEIVKLNELLEQQVAERTRELAEANKELRSKIVERDRIEASLRESERRFRSYFELGLIGMAITSPGRGFVEVNDELCRILGYERNELMQMTWAEMTHPDDLAGDVANFNRVLAGTIDGYSMEKRYIRKDGQVIYAVISVRCLRTVDGSVDYFVALLRDITEQKEADQELRQREALLSSILEALPVGVWQIDRGGHIVQGNPEGVRIWGGYRSVGIDQYGEFKGWWVKSGAPLAAKEWGGARAILHGESSLDEEIEIEGFDGQRRIILHSAVPLRDHDDRISGAIVINQDITSLKQAEEATRKSEKVYRELFEYNPLPMWVYDRSSLSFLAINDAAVNHYGYSREEFLGMQLPDIHPAESLPAILESVASDGVLRKVGVWDELRKDGTVIKVEITTHDLIYDGMSARLVLANDVTERQRAEQDILVYQESLRTLASELSLTEERERRQIATNLHDFVGQSLATAQIKLGALRGIALRPELLDLIDEIRKLIDQTLGYTRSLTFELSPPILYQFGLEAAIESLVDSFRRQYGINITFLNDGEQKLLNDEMRVLLYQSVKELLFNVVKHSHALSAEVSCRRVNNCIEICVSDDGRGLSSSKNDLAFREQGGFGLFSIRERLRHLGGRLLIDSAEGEGTIVTLTAPLK